MKKIFFALAALVLAFTGCSQEEDAIQVSEKKAIKVVVNMDKPGFGEDTRQARTGWEEGDEVDVMLGGDLGHLIALKYDGTSWKEVVLSFDAADGEWEEVDEEEANDYLANLPSSGDLKAIYCSSGISYFAPIPLAAIPAAQLTGINIYSNARDNEDYDYYLEKDIPNPLGECIMTCEDGTYSASGGVLTLTITMIPQVAQFTIKDLNVEDDYTVEYAGTMTAYAGGTITPTGVELNPVGEPFDPYGAWVHDNEDGISIYASPWQVAPDGVNQSKLDKVGLGYFLFIFYDADDNEYYREFPGKTDLKNGDAVIFDGPTTVGAEDKWVEPV
ncbi:MAG: hypothetical protein E7098_06745 [Mediterranea massiliensis]|nr:hypothetical protein [Mediterranea massiliensis]